ncbi:MAG: sigma-70 family RNA polymerase sigma factor, partial [Alphaproteobacteria bacterium]
MNLYAEGDLAPDKVREIATTLNVSETEVVEMNRRLSAPDSSLNTPVGDDTGVERQDLLVDRSPGPEAVLAETEEAGLRRRLLREALGSLNSRERHIIENRHLSATPLTLDELGRHYGVSRERVRQIEANALARLTAAVREAWRCANAPRVVSA